MSDKPRDADSQDKQEQQKTESARNGSDSAFRPDLGGLERQKSTRRGDAYVRIVRPDPHLLRRVAPGVLRATEQVSEPHGGLSRLYRSIKKFLVGRPLPTVEEKHERLSKIKALAIFSSDAISSNAYATEEILIVLVTAGAAALGYALPIAMAIALLLGIVAFSYRQTVQAYPHGGGSYTVSKENLGTQAGLIAASALLIDYVLTVAVSIAAGTAAITSAFESLIPYQVPIAVGFIVLITLINLRGVRESGTVFAIPTYLFIFGLTAVIIIGVAQVFLGLSRPSPAHLERQAFEPLTLFLLLHAFAAGSVAMSGTEAISNGVPAFQPPEPKNAAATLTWMASILAFFFVGITFLANSFGIVPSESETVISQIGRMTLGSGIPYLFFQATTTAILVLAANTGFNGFPRLAWILAQDGFMPHQLSFRGDRLAFSNGIIMLGAIASILIIAFGGSTHALIPLYAVGVFVSFTLSQTGMVLHWWRLRHAGWLKSMLINGLGATATAVVLVVVASVKFLLGAWMVLLLIPILVFIFNSIHSHYVRVAQQLDPSKADGNPSAPRPQVVLVLVGDVSQAALRALAFARSISSHPIAVRMIFEESDVESIRRQWARWGDGTELVLLESPYRSFTEPIMAYIDQVQLQNPDAYVTVVVPEFLPAHWWEHALHNQTALRLKTALLFHPNVVIVDVPYHLRV